MCNKFVCELSGDRDQAEILWHHPSGVGHVCLEDRLLVYVLRVWKPVSFFFFFAIAEYNFHHFSLVLIHSDLSQLKSDSLWKRLKKKVACLSSIRVFCPLTSFAYIHCLVISTKLPTWVMMMRSQSSPLQCLSKRETPSSSSHDPSKTWCW